LEGNAGCDDQDHESAPNPSRGKILGHSLTAIQNGLALLWHGQRPYTQQAEVRGSQEEAGLPGQQEAQPKRLELGADNESRQPAAQKQESDHGLPLRDA